MIRTGNICVYIFTYIWKQVVIYVGNDYIDFVATLVEINTWYKWIYALNKMKAK